MKAPWWSQAVELWHEMGEAWRYNTPLVRLPARVNIAFTLVGVVISASALALVVWLAV